MNWGKSIVLAFVLFGAFIATLVTICMQQDVSLVTKDYYREELAYQRQIDRMAQTATLSEKPVIQLEGPNLLKVSYREFSKVRKGALELFRPSDPALDKHFVLPKTSEPSLYFSTEGLEKGMYRARLRWSMNGREFFLEEVIRL